MYNQFRSWEGQITMSDIMMRILRRLMRFSEEKLWGAWWSWAREQTLQMDQVQILNEKGAFGFGKVGVAQSTRIYQVSIFRSGAHRQKKKETLFQIFITKMCPTGGYTLCLGIEAKWTGTFRWTDHLLWSSTYRFSIHLLNPNNVAGLYLSKTHRRL